MLLDSLAFALQRIHVVAEGQGGRHVNGVPHQVMLHIHMPSLRGRLLPSPLQPQCDAGQHWKEIAQPVRVERLRDRPALPAPHLALGGEHAERAQLQRHRLERADTAIGLGPVMEDLVDQLPLRDHQGQPVHQADAVQGTERLAPLLEDQVHPPLLPLQLQRAA